MNLKEIPINIKTRVYWFTNNRFLIVKSLGLFGESLPQCPNWTTVPLVISLVGQTQESHTGTNEDCKVDVVLTNSYDQADLESSEVHGVEEYDAEEWHNSWAFKTFIVEADA